VFWRDIFGQLGANYLLIFLIMGDTTFLSPEQASQELNVENVDAALIGMLSLWTTTMRS